MKTPDYDQHEFQYRHLREKGFSGWGGESLDRRMQGWKETVQGLVTSPIFPKPGAKLLEIGTGAGDSLIPFAERGYEVTGIDISPTAIHWACNKFNEKKLQAQFFVANLAKASLPFNDDSFDAVIDAACLHCLIGTDRVVAVKEVVRVLKPGGFMLVSHMVNDPRELLDGVVFDSSSRTQEKDGTSYRSMPKLESLKDELVLAGLKIIRETVRQNAWWDHAEIWCSKLDEL